MRVTAETKAATRLRILAAASQLFATRGYDASTTREIADAAGIATGTLFNYFATKEAILTSLAAEAMADIDIPGEAGAKERDIFEADLFALVAAGLRKLKHLRKHLPVLLETTLSPLALEAAEEALSLRVLHLETVARLAKLHGLGELPSIALQLYWTLYTGVLIFWARDKSPKQEETLALLDHSLAMFVGWLEKSEIPQTPAE